MALELQDRRSPSGSLESSSPVRLRPPERQGLQERFAASDPRPGWDLTAHPRVAKLVRSRKFQFFLILPNQIIFWTVIFVGLLGTAVPGLNFGAAITWYVWFCLVFVMMVVVGRAWCAMCPFGGFAEWIQRLSPFRRTQRSLGLGLKFPERLARVGFLIPVASFWTRDREVCLTCPTKDCMRGGTDGYGCPWYTWPGSADSNLYCGLCSECYKACPEGNVGLFVQKPLTSLVAPRRRRPDIAWGVAALWGLVLYQQVNATNAFSSADTWLNRELHFPHYPNPVDYVGFIGLGVVATAAVAWLMAALFADRRYHFDRPGNFQERSSRFRSFFVPMSYGLVPVVGADYFARQLPKFLQHAPRVLPAVAHIAGFSSVRSPVYSFSLMSNGWIVLTQVAVVALGTLAAAWASWRIVGAEVAPASRHGLGVRLASVAFVLACGTAAAVLYVVMHAAD